MKLIGATIQERKVCLANLVVEHLLSIGKSAEVVRNYANSAGHRDLVMVKSCIGLIHLTATDSVEQNAILATADYKDGNQRFLTDKTFVAFGWNTKTKRTFLMFVPVEKVIGTDGLPKNDIPKLRDKTLSIIYETK